MTLRSVLLGFIPSVTTLLLDDGSVVTLGPSAAALAHTCFRHDRPAAAELEHAIDIVEDALMAAKVDRSPGAGLTTCEPTLRRLPGLEGVGATLDRDAVEALFQQMAPIALGMPNPRGAVVTQRAVAAALLITRECMHHLGFESIRVGPAAASSQVSQFPTENWSSLTRQGTSGPEAALAWRPSAFA